MTPAGRAPTKLTHLLAPWFNDMSDQEFERVCDADNSDLVLEAYLHLSRQEADVNRFSPEEVLLATRWMMQSKHLVKARKQRWSDDYD